jgi:hypothetical protein
MAGGLGIYEWSGGSDWRWFAFVDWAGMFLMAAMSLRESNVLPIAVVPGFLRFKQRCG